VCERERERECVYVCVCVCVCVHLLMSLQYDALQNILDFARA